MHDSMLFVACIGACLLDAAAFVLACRGLLPYLQCKQLPHDGTNSVLAYASAAKMGRKHASTLLGADAGH